MLWLLRGRDGQTSINAAKYMILWRKHDPEYTPPHTRMKFQLSALHWSKAYNQDNTSVAFTPLHVSVKTQSPIEHLCRHLKTYKYSPSSLTELESICQEKKKRETAQMQVCNACRDTTQRTTQPKTLHDGLVRSILILWKPCTLHCFLMKVYKISSVTYILFIVSRHCSA